MDMDKEFIAEKCEEIAANDNTYQKLMKDAITANRLLREALKNFENATAALQAYSEKLMLQSGLDISTAQNTAQNTAQKIINQN